jgi:serine/threonine-protein kinase
MGKLSRYRLSIGMRIFLMSALLIFISLSIVVGFTYQVSRTLAEKSVAESLTASLALQRKFQELDERDLVTALDSFSGDPNFVAYILNAIESTVDTELENGQEADLDYLSILDLIKERSQILGLDFMIIADVDGRVIAHSQRDWKGRDIASTPLLRPVVEDLYANAGIWQEGNQLFQAAAAPLSDVNFDVIGFVIAGETINNSFSTRLKNFIGSDVVYLLASENGVDDLGSTLDLTTTDQLLNQLREQSETPLQALSSEVQLGVAYNSENHIAQLQPLAAAVPGQALPMLVTVSSPAQFRESFDQITTAVMGAGIFSIFLAFLLSYVFSSRTLKPVTQLANAADAASQGNFSQTIALSGNDELTRLGGAINHLLSNLREKQDMQNYLTQISHLIPESHGNANTDHFTVRPPRVGSLSVLAIDTSPILETTGKASVLQEGLQEITQVCHDVIQQYSGEIITDTGSQLLCSFQGDYHGLAAYASAVAIAKRTASLMKKLGGNPARFAIGDGKCLSGTHGGTQSQRPFVYGSPLLHVQRLLTEASPGECLASNGAYRNLKTTMMQHNIRPTQVEGALSQKRYCQLPLDAQRILQAPEISNRQETIGSTSKRTGSSEIRTGAFINNRYEIISTLGEGSMGSVYKAMDQELDSMVAIKLLRIGTTVDRETLENMKSEIRLARQITHQNILRTYDLGDVDGVPFITMEYVRGLTLRKLINNTQKLPYSASLRVARQLCEGLKAVHEIGVLHRDIKPENIIIELSGNVKLMDFGIARSLRDYKRERDSEKGLFVGTPRYASPEQMMGHELSVASDIYSCGVVLTELFTGSIPIEGESFTQISESHVFSPPVPPKELWPGIPDKLDSILLHCLAKRPEERYRTVSELLEQLNELSA